MKRALLFVNAKASQTEGCLESIEETLTKGGFEVERASADCAGDCATAIREQGARADLLVTAGGDGTVCCAVEVILNLTQGKLPLGIIPLGTANNVARTLGIPINVEGACQAIIGGRTVAMDLGRVNGRFFVSVAGMGLSTKVHDEVPAEQKKRWRTLAYAAHAIRLLLSKPPNFRVHVLTDGETVKVKATQLTVCNGRYYGAHLEVHSEASLDDGMLDISIIEADGRFKGFFKALLPLATGHKSHGFRLLRAPKFEIHTTPPMKIDVEGTTDLTTPARFEVLPAAIQVYAPAKP